MDRKDCSCGFRYADTTTENSRVYRCAINACVLLKYMRAVGDSRLSLHSQERKSSTIMRSHSNSSSTSAKSVFVVLYSALHCTCSPCLCEETHRPLHDPYGVAIHTTHQACVGLCDDHACSVLVITLLLVLCLAWSGGGTRRRAPLWSIF